MFKFESTHFFVKHIGLSAYEVYLRNGNKAVANFLSLEQAVNFIVRFENQPHLINDLTK